MKKGLMVVLVCLFLFTAVNVQAADSKSVVIQVKNPLPVPLTKAVTFTVPSDNMPLMTNFALFYKGNQLPLQLLNRKNNAVELKTIISFLPNETKLLTLKYGDNIKGKYNTIFKPNFSGTYFVGIGSGKLYITSLNDDNDVVIKVASKSSPISFKLNKNESKVLPIKNRDTVFSITARYPIFAEVSSLKVNCLNTSSDDVSSVYGTYFVLYIPREVVISAYVATNLKVYSSAGEKIFSGTLPPKGQYKNLNLGSGFYTISASNPVTVQFGCEDDNIYAVNYGDMNKFKGVSYGNIVCSALFPQTVVKIKTPNKNFSEVTLEKSGDYTYEDLITKFKDNESELMPVYIEYSKPVLIYSDSEHGNIGGEQIPSINGESKNFVFLTGKIFNFDGLKHKRKIAVIASEPETHILVNGKQVILSSTLSPKYFLFDKSYSLVKISADKPVSVFDIGMTTDLEYFTELIPIKDNSILWSIGLSTVPGGTTSPNSGNHSLKEINNFAKFLAPVGVFFNNLWKTSKSSSLFKNTQSTIREFAKDITPSLKSLSNQILNLFMPVAGMIYPYIHSYIPNLTQSEVAAVIFYILIAFIIILLWPKRRPKRNVPVVKVKESELKKKKNVAFNVKTIEEKGPTGIKYGARGKPKTLLPTKKKIMQPSTEKTKTVTGDKAAAPYPKAPFKNKPAIENGAELQRKTISKLPAQSGTNNVLSTNQSKGKTVAPIKRKVLNVKETEQLKEVIESPKVEKETSGKKPLQNIVSPSETAGTLSKKVDKQEVESKNIAPAQSKGILPEITQKKIVEAVEKNEKVEKSLKVSSSSAQSVETAKEKEEAKDNKKVEKNEKEKIKEKHTVTKTSLDELLERVKNDMNPTPSSLKKAPVKPKEVSEEDKKNTKILSQLETSIVMDKDAAEKVVYSGLIKQFNRTFISAREQPEIDTEKKSKYRIGTIALTPIELRIAEDLARRIGAKRSTGEALLISKKVGVKQVLVNDMPKITNYQGIKITNINDVIKE